MPPSVQPMFTSFIVISVLHIVRIREAFPRDYPGFIVRRSLLEFFTSADILAEFVAYQYYLRVLTTFAASPHEPSIYL